MHTYLITFTTYGTWLHGDRRGFVDLEHNRVGDPVRTEHRSLHEKSEQAMKSKPYTLDEAARNVVLAAIRQHAEFRGWSLLAVHVRSNHVHVVVAGEATPERMMTEFKAYASRALNALDSVSHRWTRHGSTLWLKAEDSICRAVEYVVEEQGDLMSVWCAETYEPRPLGSGPPTTPTRGC